MRNRLAAVVGALIGVGVLAVQADAQALTGTVRDSVNRLPVPGAVVTVLDSAGGMVARRLTNEQGEYRVALGTTGRIVRIVRIGFEPRELRIPPQAGDGAHLDITLLAPPSMIQTVHVVANANCPARKDRAAALGLWEQARAGLLATVVARAERPASMRRLLFERTMDGNSDRIETMRVRGDASTDTVSFVAAHSAEDLMRFGFATEGRRRPTYFGPDADVLLSEDFATAYCLELAGGGRARPNQVGIRFVPAGHQSRRTDIDGTLWVDTVAREIRDAEFRYLGMPVGAEAYHPGGHVSFVAMPNGIVLLDRWSIRLVGTFMDTVLNRSVGWYAQERGGELARVKWRDGVEWTAPLGVLHLRVLTAAGNPATGTVIALDGTPYSGTVDSAGFIRIEDLVPGPYFVRIADPRLLPLGIGVPTPLKINALRDSTINATLKVPATEAFVGGRCAMSHQHTAGDSVFLIGRVLTSDGRPVPDATITFATQQPDGPHWHSEHVVSAADGLFQSCSGWTVGDDALIRVQRFDAADAEVTHKFDSRLIAVRVTVRQAP
jgi:Carboxypeptidase regulatory-like domain